jgi:hypothetical protein
LLGEIFCEVLEASEFGEAFQATRICLVCKAWREVALATPWLWVSVRVWMEQLVDFKKVKAWLSRSGSLPKRLDVNGEDSCTGGFDGCILSTTGLANMLAEGPVLEELSLSCTSPECCHNLFKRTMAIETKGPRAWDSLQFLNLDMCEDWGGEGADFFHLLPRSLRSFSFRFPDPDDLPDGVLLPRPISHPTVSILTTNTCFWPVNWTLKTMKALPSLTHVTLNFRGCYSEYDQGPFNGDEPYILQNVRTLKLQNLYWPQLDKTRILRFLSTPSLAELEISFETDGAAEATNATEMSSDVTQFARISNDLSDLRYLRLQGMTITAKGLKRILRALPTVTHLILGAVSIHGESLAFKHDLLPQLEVFEFLDFPGDEDEVINLDEMLKFIKARGPHSADCTAGNIAPIRKATVSIAKRLPFFFNHRWFKEMEKGGVEFSFKRP